MAPSSDFGLSYESGQGVPRDGAAAAAWYRKAADQGLGRAQVNLAFLYAFGTGVPHDFVQAHVWFTLAAARPRTRTPKTERWPARAATPSQRQ